MRRVIGVSAAIVALVAVTTGGEIWLHAIRAAKTASAPAATATPLAVGGSFTCTDRTGGKGGKEMAGPAQVSSLTVSREAGFDRLIFGFTSPEVPSYALTARLDAQFVRNDPQQAVTLEGSAGLDLTLGNVASTNGYWVFKATPSKLLQAKGIGDYGTGLGRVREVALLGYFEPQPGSVSPAITSPAHWGIGLSQQSCVRVTELSNPARLVLDIDSIHPATAPQPFVLSGIDDLTFVDPSHGWLLGPACSPGIAQCELSVERTSDGGTSWSVSPLPLPVVLHDTDLPWHLRFGSTLDGWLYGSALYVTHDGGQTWKLNPAVASIVAMASAGGSVWAVTGCEPPCGVHMVASSDRGDTWKGQDVPGLGMPAFVAMTRTDGGHGWLLVRDEQASSTLISTADAGRTWRASTISCIAAPGTGAAVLSATSASDLWVACGGEPGAGQQLKQLLHSFDGGSHWVTTDLPASGYVADLVATSTTRAWLGLTRGGLLGTTDGGRTWAVKIDNFDSGIGLVRFADPVHGWASTGQQLYRTTDAGNHWNVTLDLIKN